MQMTAKYSVIVVFLDSKCNLLINPGALHVLCDLMQRLGDSLGVAPRRQKALQELRSHMWCLHLLVPTNVVDTQSELQHHILAVSNPTITTCFASMRQ